MQETIILAPGINGDELLRSMALHGKNSFNTRIMGSSELARLALTRAGITLSEGFLSIAEENLLIGAAVRDCPYFKSASLKDTIDIANTLRTARGLIPAEDEAGELHRILEHGMFPEKNEALLQVYDHYIAACKEQGSIDRVMLLRKAISMGSLAGTSLCVMAGLEISPLEQKLLEVLSNANFITVTLQQLYGVETGKALRVEGYFNCYGAANEAEHILEGVYKKSRLDSCTVAVSDPATYARLFWDLALEHDIPMTFGCGVPILNANPAKLLNHYRHWMTDGYFGKAALETMLTAPCFDKTAFLENAPALPEGVKQKIFRELLYGLRLTNRAENNTEAINRFEASLEKEPEGEEGRNATRSDKLGSLPLLRYYGEMLALPADEFMQRFSRIRKMGSTPGALLCMKLDLAALRAIPKRLREFGEEIPSEELMRDILGSMVMRQSSAAGALHITTFKGAATAMRENIYFAGLAAPMFPGSPRENYLLLDSDLELFGEAGKEKSSAARIQRKLQQLLSAVQLAADLGASLSFSYPGMNISDLKVNNASSVLFDLFRMDCGRDATVAELEKILQKVGYFDPAVSAARFVGKAYVAGEKLQFMDPASFSAEPAFLKGLLTRSFSPSAIEAYYSCPYSFFLSKVLHLPNETRKKEFDFWAPTELGITAHSIMEAISNSQIDKEGFMALAEEYFDRFAVQNRPIMQVSADTAKAEFLEMMETAFEMDPQREVALSEKNLTALHEESGITVSGYPDRVERLADGTCAIIDFKTGKHCKHIEGNPDSCLQAMLYAFLLEKTQGEMVSYGEYRYFRLGKVIRCNYDDAAKQRVGEILCDFRENLENLRFDPVIPTDEENPCEYCGYQDICPRILSSDDEEEEE